MPASKLSQEEQERIRAEYEWHRRTTTFLIKLARSLRESLYWLSKMVFLAGITGDFIVEVLPSAKSLKRAGTRAAVRQRALKRKAFLQGLLNRYNENPEAFGGGRTPSSAVADDLSRKILHQEQVAYDVVNRSARELKREAKHEIKGYLASRRPDDNDETGIRPFNTRAGSDISQQGILPDAKNKLLSTLDDAISTLDRAYDHPTSANIWNAFALVLQALSIWNPGPLIQLGIELGESEFERLIGEATSRILKLERSLQRSLNRKGYEVQTLLN